MEFLTFAWVTNPEIWLSLAAPAIRQGIGVPIFIPIPGGRLEGAAA